MRYTIRLFTTSPLSSLIPVQAQMLQNGHKVRPVGTNQLDIEYAPDYQSIKIDLVDSTNEIARREITYFLDRVANLSSHPEQAMILSVLSRALAVVAVRVPEDYDQYDNTLRDVIDIIAGSAEGLFQVDGEGFYDGSDLILKMA